jgi:hypothetical protein
MKANSTKIARAFGLVMILFVGAWDVDAMRPHLAAHSWYTLMLVGLFLAAHLGDYLTVGRLIHRFDPLILANLEDFASPQRFLAEGFKAEPAEFVSSPPISVGHALRAGYQKLFAYEHPPSLMPRPATAKLYAFTITESEAAQAVGAPPAMSPHYSVVPLE